MPEHSYRADTLVDRLARHPDLPSLGAAISRVAELTDSDTSSLTELANVILADVYLTQKVLRLANSVMFRRGVLPVTTVSGAVARVGSQEIRLFALSALLVDRVATRATAGRFSSELVRSLYASMLAQVVGPRIGADSEESAICAMFRGIGRVMVALYESDCFDAIGRIATTEHVSEAEAARRVTGNSLEQIGQRILEYWSLPDTIVKSVAFRPPGAHAPQGRIERLQLVSQFAAEVAAAVHDEDPKRRAALLASVLSSYGGALGIDSPELTQLAEATSERMRSFARALDLVVPGADGSAGGDAVTSTLGIELKPEGTTAPAAIGRSPEGKPSNASELLLAGIRDMTAGLAEGDDGQGILDIALETLHRALGYQRAVLCLLDARSGWFRARTPFGSMSRERLQKFAFPASPGADLFWSVMMRNADVSIRDLGMEALQSKLPDWYRAACPDARSFLLLPIVVKKKPIGFFYADRPVVDAAGLTAEELALVRMLKSNTIIALRTAES